METKRFEISLDLHHANLLWRMMRHADIAQHAVIIEQLSFQLVPQFEIIPPFDEDHERVVQFENGTNATTYP